MFFVMNSIVSFSQAEKLAFFFPGAAQGNWQGKIFLETNVWGGGGAGSFSLENWPDAR